LSWFRRKKKQEPVYGIVYDDHDIADYYARLGAAEAREKELENEEKARLNDEKLRLMYPDQWVTYPAGARVSSNGYDPRVAVKNKEYADRVAFSTPAFGKITFPSVMYELNSRKATMAPKHKIGDKFEQGTVRAVRNTDWYDKTTTFSYMVLPNGTDRCAATNLWFDEKELTALVVYKFKVGEKVSTPYDYCGTITSCHSNKSNPESQKKWYCTNLGTFYEKDLKKWVNPAKFKVDDFVTKRESRKMIVTRVYFKNDRWYYDTDLSMGYRETELIKWVEPLPVIGLAVGSVRQPDNWLTTTTPVRKKAPPLTPKAPTAKKKGCEHFRETEFVTIAKQRTMVKNKFCPDCGKRVR
jgi:hypothetical protein